MATNYLNELSNWDWQIFEGMFQKAEPLKAYSWAEVNSEWESSFDELLNELKAEHLRLLKLSNRSLKIFGGDPSSKDWSTFRPLRLSREEDWADWLIQLFQSSESGSFAFHLFNREDSLKQKYIRPLKTRRELTDKSLRYRADIIINWEEEEWTHIEVKIGDSNLKKTYPTSEVFRNQFGVSVQNWKNYILLLDEQLSDWENVSSNNNDDIIIESITWTDIAIALRKSIHADESLTWKVWAYSFLGAIEQSLLHLTFTADEKMNPNHLLKHISILKSSLDHE